MVIQSLLKLKLLKVEIKIHKIGKIKITKITIKSNERIATMMVKQINKNNKISQRKSNQRCQKRQRVYQQPCPFLKNKTMRR